jgi:hypothetical protein
MRHLQAGLMIGGVWLVIVLIAISIVVLLSVFFGTALAVAILATTIVVIAGAAFIDWYSERRTH